jgi:hypothetical protein
MMNCGPKNLSKDQVGRIANTFLENGGMRGYLLDGAVSRYETDVGEVGRIEFGQCLLVVFRLKILESQSVI